MGTADTFRQAERITRERALTEMADYGIDDGEQLLRATTPVNAIGWVEWAKRQRNVTTGLLAAKIRTGQPAPKPRSVDLDEQKAYGEEIRRFLLEKMPDVCRDDERIVEWERRLYGERAILASVAEPHPAAMAAVIRLHYRHGKGALTLREHGAEIRAAVRAANEQAIADYEAIAGKQERGAQQ